jgi:hypothetical protein
VDNRSQRLELELNPARLASIIDNAVVISSEIVNFHFNALANADLAQPAKAADARYRFQAPAMGAAERRAMHERWILANAFHELLGERLSFTVAEFNEIAFACHFLGQQLSAKLPRPKVAEDK